MPTTAHNPQAYNSLKQSAYNRKMPKTKGLRQKKRPKTETGPSRNPEKKKKRDRKEWADFCRRRVVGSRVMTIKEIAPKTIKRLVL